MNSVNSMNEGSACRVCGFEEQRDAEGSRCPCCRHEPGAGDDVLGVREVRGAWMGRGAVWHDPGRTPQGWDLFAQLARIPPRWR
ncbi:hypothetical protein GCM10010329_46180 [Streptomyces spiroverticillatus]|uniref:Uncharacterized protein n=1 Tax=Streptomyces finlayi TaxID=67296 RepID=A0A918X041_9ACTN|nr:hypothetical protein [Streptomyces finlayi]GHA17861.1 hypothetical protein GCM10010329_46180 [Streptomyces spiroverticillatus]GHC99610.1 hypothetical protein GCM10010334_43350 [Streptomyces finlayi]